VTTRSAPGVCTTRGPPGRGLAGLPADRMQQGTGPRAVVVYNLEVISVACEFPDVFPEDLPGMPPDRDVEFIIEL
jgi:hypothetical protein